MFKTQTQLKKEFASAKKAADSKKAIAQVKKQVKKQMREIASADYMTKVRCANAYDKLAALLEKIENYSK